MPIACCSACGAKVHYVGEQTGQTALCTGCNGNVVLRQSSMQVVQAAISILLAAISIGVLVFFGLMGGIVAWATHGTLIVIVGVLAIIFGMRVRDVFLILTLYLWMTVVGRAMLKSGRASRGTTDTYVRDVNPGRRQITASLNRWNLRRVETRGPTRRGGQRHTLQIGQSLISAPPRPPLHGATPRSDTHDLLLILSVV
jgi:hypothetical protein